MSLIAALIGSSTIIRHVQHLISKVAESDSPVLLTGEPGTGKESLARAIHEKSSRNEGPFVPVKCASIPEENLYTEIMGEVTGGVYRPGRVAIAAGGTLYLDDVSKLSTQMQARILALLQEGVFLPFNSSEARSANTRIICSTGIQIDQAVREGRFREDLYYRLAGCSIYVPPLRERREDIGALVEHFIQLHGKEKAKRIMGIAPDAMSALLQHSWDHNIKELENLIERIVVLKNGGMIEVSDMPPRLRKLVTDDIDHFYQTTQEAKAEASLSAQRQTGPGNSSGNSPGTRQGMTGGGNHSYHSTMSNQNGRSQEQGFSQNYPPNRKQNSQNSFPQPFGQNPNFLGQPMPPSYEESSEIDQFIRKDIDLASGIDFYRVVEEFENRLIAEALRRTNHNKNRAAQLLSMNRTTLVEKLKKRAASSTVKMETGRVKRNPAFTIFDGLGSDSREFETFDFIKDSLPPHSQKE